jgi:hypothetical protein
MTDQGNFEVQLRRDSHFKVAKRLRREIRAQAHLLHEKMELLLVLDPSFEQELERLQLLPAFNRFRELSEERRTELRRLMNQ